HVLAWWDHLGGDERSKLVEQLRGINWPEVRGLFALRDQKSLLPEADRIAPLPRPQEDATARASHRRLGEEAIAAGQVAYLVVAGGQGSRLGFEHPKGMFPVGPVSGKSLFQIH